MHSGRGCQVQRQLAVVQKRIPEVPKLEALLYAIQVGTYTVADSPTLYPPRTQAVEEAAVWITDGDADYITVAPDVEGPRVPAGEAYTAVESANGELGFYLVSDGSAVPVKVRCRPPSFINLPPMAKMLEGALLADLIPTFDFINMVGGECDR